METINKTNKSRVLLLGDNAGFSSLSETLTRANHCVTKVDTIGDAVSKLNEQTYQLTVIGTVTSSDTREAIASVKSAFPWVEVLAVLESADRTTTLDMIQAGAHDCLTGDSSTDELKIRVMKALDHGRIKQELSNLRQHVAMSYGFDNIVGISRPVTALKETIQRVSPTDITLLISGPLGSGKELAAKVIHYHSMRRKNSFVTVDCAAIPERLFESELFGEESGIERANVPPDGCLLMKADGGTVFFDNVERLPAAVQPRLMRFLKDFTIMPAGKHQPVKIDVRIVSATSVDLEAMTREHCFSRELYYQIGVLPVNIPSLADRLEDVEMLSEYFLRRFAQEADCPMFELTRSAMDLLVAHGWPGNVRELENTLKRATALCRENRIDADDILFITTERTDATGISAREKMTLRDNAGTLDEGQRKIIIKALSENDWNFTQTAQELGIGRTTLWRKVKKYNLKRETVAS